MRTADYKYYDELATLKPAARQLTCSYLIIASGGAAGGLVIAVIAPLVFNDDYDLAITLAILGALVYLIWMIVPHSDSVKITSDNPKYDSYERMLDKAHIQGRVIGKWLWT